MTPALTSAYFPGLWDLIGLAAIFVTGAAFLGLGRLVSPVRGLVEIEAVAGWGLACLVLTLWGAATEATMRIPAVGILLAGAVGLILPATRLRRDDWAALLRILLLSLPVWLILAPERPAMTDTFMNLLPNAAYLVDHGMFPADHRAASFSFLPGAPYNTQFVPFIASLLTPGSYPVSGMAHFNVLLQVLSGLLIARVLRRPAVKLEAAPSWGLCAWGLLLAIALNPGFSPRVHFSSYGEASISVTLGLAAWLTMRLLGKLADGEPRGTAIIQLALVLAALVNIKQASVALVAATVASAVVLAMMDRRIRFMEILRDLNLALLPALILYLVWRYYVLDHFAAGELKPMPLSRWQFGLIPALILDMLKIMANKGFFFVCLAVAMGGFAALWAKRGIDGTARLAGLVTGVFLAYSAFLLATYIGHFVNEGEPGAHSYFRYSTHLSLAIVLALAALYRSWMPAVTGWRWAVSTLGIVLVVAAPVLFLKRLRFDLIAPQPFVADLAQLAARHVGPNEKLALLLPGDNTSVAWTLKAWMRFVPPRRLDLEIAQTDVAEPAVLASLAAKGYRKALLSCTTDAFPDLPPRSAVFLVEEEGRWQAAETLAYPPADPKERWTGILSGAPFCRDDRPGRDEDSDLAPANSAAHSD